MTKRCFRPRAPSSEPDYPSRRRLLAFGAAAALAACGPIAVTDGDPVMPEVDAGLDAAFETGGGAPQPDAGLPDAGEPDAGLPDAGAPDAGLEGGVAPMPDGGE